MKNTTQPTDTVELLPDFDIYIEKLKTPQRLEYTRVGIGIVAQDRVVFAQRYGDRSKNLVEGLLLTYPDLPK
ncbi:MAG: hypothetical protein AAF298_05250 [Cyanobacteria bacterium P01_A01_bin.40]